MGATSLTGAAAWAQSLAGLAALNGTVVDPAGAAVAAAKVTVRNAGLGIERMLTTNEAGYFSASSLTPSAEYVVRVEHPGFRTYESEKHPATGRSEYLSNVNLEIGAQADAVTVVDTPPLIEQTKTGVSSP